MDYEIERLFRKVGIAIFFMGVLIIVLAMTGCGDGSDRKPAQESQWNSAVVSPACTPLVGLPTNKPCINSKGVLITD